MLLTSTIIPLYKEKVFEDVKEYETWYKKKKKKEKLRKKEKKKKKDEKKKAKKLEQ